jgi:hypothetical protein
MPMPMPNARMTPMAESRSRRRAPSVAISTATMREPASVPATGFPAMTKPAAAPVKASSAVPCTAKDMPQVTTSGPMSP